MGDRNQKAIIDYDSSLITVFAGTINHYFYLMIIIKLDAVQLLSWQLRRPRVWLAVLESVHLAMCDLH